MLANARVNHLSAYAENLSDEVKTRYKEKLKIIKGFDPFTGTTGELADRSPPVEAADIVSYLVLQTSFITAKQFKARKGLEAYNQFVSGWVKEVCNRRVAGKFVVTGRVRHSQRLNDTPLSCWIIIEETGEVCCAHCNCMAGLGETCTHIAAVLFYLEAITRIQGTETCTQKECGWLIPSYMKTVEYQAVKNIDFTSASGKKRKFDEMMEDDSPLGSFEETISSQGSPSTDAEMGELFEKLSLAGTKPAILTLIAPYSEKYIPKSSLDVFPKPLKSLQQPSYLQLPYHELLNLCETVSIEVNDEMAKSVEKETRSQSKCNLWFELRAGRVTASCMKQVCHTDVTNPAQSLVKSICYPQELSFSSKQTDWGQKHEKVARELYLKTQKQNHNDLKVADSGLVINPQWPFIAATPDGIIDCKCCGKGVLEIKCPYSHRDESVESAASKDRSFYLKKCEGSLHLDHGHSYYYQVQTQMFVCNVDYCDFCVCTFSTAKEGDFPPYIERIFRDDKFWETCLTKAKHFFTVCLLPETLGNWYTRPAVTSADACHSTQSVASGSPEQQVYCYCCGPEEGTMIACDNEACKIEWFHKDCLKMKSLPRGKWYCPDCRKLPQFLKGKGKGKATKQ